VLAPGLGASKLAALDVPVEALGALAGRPAAQLRALGLERETIEALHAPDPDRLEACLGWLDHPRHHLVTRADALYPPLLARIPDPPVALFVNGCAGALVRAQVGIVGSRNATAGGLAIAREFAAALSRAGLVVTSGLADGIDGAAHAAAIDAGGWTLAVAGTGPDQVYPAKHRELAGKIVDNGAVITSFAPGTGPRPGHFPARNRIISGMSAGILVVEAGMRSGSLITARLAGEQGREVFAIPGSIRNPQARGCHRLLRQGARLVETPDELLDELRPLVGELAGELALRLDAGTEAGAAGQSREGAAGVDAESRALLEAIGYDPVSVDELIARSGLDTRQVSALLLQLELDGRVSALGGGRYCRT